MLQITSFMKLGQKVRVSSAFKLFGRSSTVLGVVLVLVMLAAAGGEIYFTNKTGMFTTEMYSIIPNDDRELFKKSLVKFLGYVLALAAVITIKLYLSNIAAIVYRRQINTIMHKEYMQENSFYELLLYNPEIDNPDHRLTQDIQDYTTTLMDLLVKCIKGPINIFYYGYQIVILMNGWSLVLCIAFAVVSYIITRIAMIPVTSRVYKYQAANADFRLRHAFVRENSEIVCMSEGQEREKSILIEKLTNALNIQKSLANFSFPLDTIIQLVAYYGSIVCYFAIYVYLTTTKKDIPDVSTFTYTAQFQLFWVINGITTILGIMDLFAKVCGYSMRINELWDLLKEHKQYVKEANHDFCIAAKHVTISKPLLPDPQYLINDLTFEIHQGQTLFISGPSGCGKSSIFRVLGQIWPCGEGSVTTPEPIPENIIILTQKPYIPDGTLLECLCFPLPISELYVDSIQSAINLLKLDHLLSRPANTWAQGLSPGERQRIAIARVFIIKPKFVLLDEATSAIPQDLEIEIYKKLKDGGVSYITIAHNHDLQVFHDMSLQIDDKGGYTLYQND